MRGWVWLGLYAGRRERSMLGDVLLCRSRGTYDEVCNACRSGGEGPGRREERGTVPATNDPRGWRQRAKSHTSTLSYQPATIYQQAALALCLC